MLEARNDSVATDAPINDLGPLAWVFDELRKSLEGANKAIRRFVRESEHSRHSDLEAVDPGALRMARQQIHQAVGALEMVGLAAPAQVMRAMESAVQRFVRKPVACDEVAAGKIERASFALVEYLEAVLNGKQIPPVALFSQYRDVQELAGAERIHPADLWSFDHRGIEMAPQAHVRPAQVDEPSRSRFDRLVLLTVKVHSAAASMQLARMSEALAVGADNLHVQTFWRVAAGFFEAISQKRLPLDAYVKRAASRVLLQLGALSQDKTRAEVSETLLHDLLFFCSQAVPQSNGSDPHLEAVRAAFGLGSERPFDYSRATLGQYDPAQLVQARKRIAAGKQSWALLAGGDASRARSVLEQYTLIGESLMQLHPGSSDLARALVKAAEQAARAPHEVKPELSMEVATTTLYLEAAFDDFEPHAPGFSEKVQKLAERLESMLAGEPAQALEPWMEQLYRRVSDRQTMGSVVGELKIALGEAEKLLDQFFRSPQETAGLNMAVTQLVQMRGVLSVLGLDQAVQALAHMRAVVERILQPGGAAEGVLEDGSFQLLGNNLSALSFLVDMLNYQPALAKKLFVFDQQSGELKSLMGRVVREAVATPLSHAEARTLSEDVQRVVEGAQHEVDLASLSEQLGTLAEQAELADQDGVARAAREAAEAVVGADVAAGAQALVELAQTGQVDVPAPAVANQSVEDDDDDLRGIFLEEGREVVAAGLAALDALDHEPSNLEQLTALRRAFHTLKGSSRMVGLNEFGEAAWAMEQVLNSVLAEQRTAEHSLRTLAREAVVELGRWLVDVASSADGHWSAEPFRASALAWRDGHQHLPLRQGTTADTKSVESVPAADVAAVEVVLEDAIDASADVGVQGVDALEVVVPEAPAQQLSETVVIDTDSLAGQPTQAVEPLLADFDLSGLEAPASEAPTPLPEVSESPVDVTVQEDLPSMFADISFDMEGEFATSGLSGEVEVQEPATPPVSEPVAPAAPVEEVVAAEDQTRIIGPLQIGIRLYNVYLNEADEWSRRLGTALSEWSLERHEPLPESAEAWAHSLAGSSATVGFQPLSVIARALEHALGHVTVRQQAGVPAAERHAQLFVEAADEIRRLLHQFAAGFYKEASAELLAELDALQHLPVPVMDVADTENGSAEEEDEGLLPPQAALPELPELTGVTPESEANGFPVTGISVQGVPDPVPPIPQWPTLEMPEVSLETASSLEDDIDVLDTIDADLFPIFAEEAQELLPQMGGALRQWKARPENGSARGEVLRGLHTLKGSARLAGALRLGEMAHRMETAVERLGSDVPDAGAFEHLQSSYDALCSRFETLRMGGQDSADIVRTAAEDVPADELPPTTYTVTTEDVPLPGDVPGESASAVLPLQGLSGLAMPQAPQLLQQRGGAAVRVRPELLDRLMNQTGEVMISRTRMEAQLGTLRTSLKDLTGNLDRLRHQLRDIELQAETQMQSRLAQARDAELAFDPLEFDRFTRVQELTRMMAESVNDVATVQRNIQRAVEATEDGLVAQARQTRELQRDLLRTRMVEFDSISERLYRVVRQASKETGKQVRLDITSGHIEMDRGVLDRMTAAFEHLLRNSVVHGIETPEQRRLAGKPDEGRIEIALVQELNEVSVVFKDDGAGLDLVRLREKGEAQGLLSHGAAASDDEIAQLIYTPGISTATEVSSLAGRGVGMDVVRTDVIALGGRIVTETQRGQGTSFQLILPLTTAVTHVVMLRAGELVIGVPSTVVELVRRLSNDELAQAYASRTLRVGDQDVPFFWSGALLHASPRSLEAQVRSLPVVIFRSASQRVAMHVDEVLGNQEVVVKNLGPQLSRLPGLAGMSVLASGAVVLIYNPVALAAVYGAQVPAWIEEQLARHQRQVEASGPELPVEMAVQTVPLVLVVDDSITVRRVTQRLLQREGYRVALAADGLQALEKLQQEKPAVVLSDIEMPRMDGFDLVRNIRNDVRMAGLPVIMITSRIAEKHREHARELGVDHYLGKPYSEDELLSLVAMYAHQTAANA